MFRWLTDQYPDILSRQLTIQSKSLDTIQNLARNQEKMLALKDGSEQQFQQIMT